MVEGYLMRTRHFIEDVLNGLGTPDNYFYQVFIPETGKLLGYFKDKELNLSGKKFYASPGPKTSKKLLNKIQKGKFVGKVNISETHLDNLNFAEENLKTAKLKFEGAYESLERILEFFKPQK